MLQVHKNLVNICYIILSEAAISIKISNLLICFCSFDVFCPILEKDNSYIVLSYLIAFFIITSFVSIVLSLKNRKIKT